MASTITLNRGSDLEFSVSWPDPAGDPMDLTGWTVEAYDVAPALADHLTLTITDATGPAQITGRIAWAETLPRWSFFRIRIRQGQTELSTPRVEVQIA